jgi:ABC-type sugar transport system permease subunit
MYRYAFIRFQFGYGSAVALVMLVFCLIFSVAYQLLNRSPDPLSGI